MKNRLEYSLPRQLQRDLLFQLVRDFNIAGAPFRAGLHGDLGDLGSTASTRSQTLHSLTLPLKERTELVCRAVCIP